MARCGCKATREPKQNRHAQDLPSPARVPRCPIGDAVLCQKSAGRRLGAPPPARAGGDAVRQEAERRRPNAQAPNARAPTGARRRAITVSMLVIKGRPPSPNGFASRSPGIVEPLRAPNMKYGSIHR
jgi:hypothetical protein